jgi:hypothetical protein
LKVPNGIHTLANAVPGKHSFECSTSLAAEAEALGDVSDDAVWRYAQARLALDRRQSWCVSTDPEFSRKASEIVGLYLNPPENAIVLSVDENLAFRLWSGLKATSVYPTVEPSLALPHEYKRHIGFSYIFSERLTLLQGMANKGARNSPIATPGQHSERPCAYNRRIHRAG